MFLARFHAFLRPLIWLFINLVMRKQTLVSQPYNPFHFYRIGTPCGCQYSQRRSRAGTYQIKSARLSKNGTRITFCLGYFSSSTHFDLVIRLAQMVWRQCVLRFCSRSWSRGGNCNGLLVNTGRFLSTGDRYLFLLQRQ